MARRLVAGCTVALASKCEGNKGECDEDDESALHVGRVDRWDQRLMPWPVLEKADAFFVVASPMVTQFC